MKRLTMKQVGELVGVSQSTVSRVLSGAPSNVPVAPETRDRILKVVADLGYSPNPVARALRSARTGLLGLIVRDINDPFFSMAVAAITAEAHRHRYSVVLGHADSSAHEALALSETLVMGHCEGAILLGDLRDQAAFWMRARAARRMPLVGLWQGSRAPHIPVVNVDNAVGIRLAIEHLVGLGHRRIAFIQGGQTGDGLERRDAFRAVLHDLGIPTPERNVLVVPNAYEAAEAGVERMLRGRARPTALVASTDLVAVAALKAASQVGLSVPREVSVVGFDDIPLVRITIPSLTTIRQPMQELSRRALARLMSAMGDGQDTIGHVEVIPPTLVVRDSTAQAPADNR
ncbi:MAG: LacI family DNA-binding transcriptional regulator [Chloroflexi bacterium]|nr:LacI family DNA-binding transcriptional regulator [Chloroflexota bacterium]MBV9894638.1 LacI family DNA-binding transcriptional regulator [Chloroflexota bacterium]